MKQPVKKERTKRKWNIEKILQWLPVYMTFLVLPWVTYYKIYVSRFAGEAFFIEETTNYDFNLYYKQTVFFYITGAVCLLLGYLFYKRRTEVFERLKFRKQWMMLVPAGVFVFFAFLSSVCSEHREAAFFGCDTQFESFFVWAGYVLLAVYLFLLMKDEKDMKLAGIAVGISMASLSVLGILQYSGHNLYHFEWYQKLITPSVYLETVGFIEPPGDEVVLNAYNTNYAGVLLATLAALCLGVLLTEKKLSRMIAEVVLLVALVTCQIGTGSRAGLLVLVVTAVLAVIYLARRLLKYWYVLIPAVTFMVLCGALFIQYLNLPIVERIQAAFAIEKTADNPIERMVTTENGVEITYKGTYFKVRMSVVNEEFNFVVIDEKGSRIPLVLSEEGTYYTLDHEVLSEIRIAPSLLEGVTPIFILTMEGREWVFLPKAKWAEEYLYLNGFGQWDTMEETKRISFQGYERFASNRGLIWSQTLPVLFEKVLIGEGANCFAFAYPQNNYKDMYYYTGAAIPVTRPHNMYLQIGVENGMIALIGMVVFWAWYLLASVKLYVKSRFETWTERIGFGCFLAVFVYLVCGLTNDSMITVAPLFWGILGIGLAANYLVRKGQETAESVLK